MTRYFIFLIIVFLAIGSGTNAGAATLTLKNYYSNAVSIYDVNYIPVNAGGSGSNLVISGLPSKPLMLVATLTVPNYGKMTFSAANGGAGYIANSQTLDVITEFANHRVMRVQSIIQQSQQQQYIVPAYVQTLITTAATYLTQAQGLPAGSQARADAALQSLQYSCPAAEAVVVEIGRQKLNRQGGLRSNQALSIFGVYENSEGQAWRDAARIFGRSVQYWSWQWQWQGEGQYIQNFMNQDGTVSRLTNAGKDIRGHALVWLWNVPPVSAGQAAFSPVTLAHLISSHADYATIMATRYPQVNNWVIGNEFHSWDTLGTLLQPEDCASILKSVGQAVGAANPQAVRGVVSTVLWGDDAMSRLGQTSPRVYAPYQFYQTLNSTGVPYEYIGMQLYANDRDIFEVYELLGRYSLLGKRIHACEMQTPSYDTPQPGNTIFPSGVGAQTTFKWHRDWDPELQAEWLEGMFVVCLSQDSVDEWNWWDLADYPANYYPWGGLLSSNYVAKPSYWRLSQLKNQWRPDNASQQQHIVDMSDLASFAASWLISKWDGTF